MFSASPLYTLCRHNTVYAECHSWVKDGGIHDMIPRMKHKCSLSPDIERLTIISTVTRGIDASHLKCSSSNSLQLKMAILPNPYQYYGLGSATIFCQALIICNTAGRAGSDPDTLGWEKEQQHASATLQHFIIPSQVSLYNLIHLVQLQTTSSCVEWVIVRIICIYLYMYCFYDI